MTERGISSAVERRPDLPGQRLLPFEPPSRWSDHQFDLAALDQACRVILSAYQTACAVLWRGGTPDVHEDASAFQREATGRAVADWQAGRAQHDDVRGGWIPWSCLADLCLAQAPIERLELVAEDCLWEGAWVPAGLWQYLLLGRWEPVQARKDVLARLAKSRGRR